MLSLNNLNIFDYVKRLNTIAFLNVEPRQLSAMFTKLTDKPQQVSFNPSENIA